MARSRASATRWFRLNSSWDKSEWLYDLEADVRLAWVLLLGHVKNEGVRGVIATPVFRRLSAEWRLSEDAIYEMFENAVADGAILVDEECWTITGWSKYQPHDAMTSTERSRKRRAAKRNTRNDGNVSSLHDVAGNDGALQPVSVSVAVARDGTKPRRVNGKRAKNPPESENPRSRPETNEHWHLGGPDGGLDWERI